MRLICPNCGAQYEVPDDVIPQAGRDVQCSNCGHTWFQPHPSQDAGLAEELDETLPGMDWDEDEDLPPRKPAPVPERPVPERAAPERPAPRPRSLDPKVADVLRAEAEREARARAAEAGALESQPDLGLEDPDTAAPARRKREEDAAKAPAARASEVKQAGSRRDLLPDIDEINSTLRSASERRELETAQARAEDTFDAPGQSGFGKGFRYAILLAVILAAVYIMAPRILDLLPQAAPVIDPYVAAIDAARVWLDGLLGQALGTLDGMSSEAGQ
ncbi:zinc-ribbon domain-containing protein [Mesobacterium sp. TK19101]|uniref:Zinc-ribbon domain-containing protein n=1 Tax=Mesobacterium hydrothermale TaxID=3111907 RepID=A0ABU6HBI3_9RHOB|nr:zinc-ribbon domain-containing protein [Mesobacterium sp. TK19101]MEC3859822.1 zinc-ribbon domain-containing protein [Mesobacterium sp. TK19101]